MRSLARMGSMGTYGSISSAQIIQPQSHHLLVGGIVVTWCHITEQKTLEKKEFFKEDRQYAWVGDGGFIMHDILDDRKTVQCIGAVITDETWGPNEWKKPLNRKKLEDFFATWADGPIAKGMIEASQSQCLPRIALRLFD